MQSSVRLRARAIEENDIAAVASLLGKGFHFDSDYYLKLLQRLVGHAVPTGFPRFGYSLECDERLVGAILLIFSSIRIGNLFATRCHVTSWYVEPEFRAYGALFYSRALRHKDVTYLNISARAKAQPIIEIQGFAKYSYGLLVLVTPLQALIRRRHRRIVSVEDARALPGFDSDEAALLLDHEKYGCISIWCFDGDRVFPFVFRERKLKGLLPGVQLMYCRNIESVVTFSGAISAFLTKRAYYFLCIDSNGPMPGLAGKYFPKIESRWWKGPNRPRLGDLSYTQLAMCGRPSDRL